MNMLPKETAALIFFFFSKSLESKHDTNVLMSKHSFHMHPMRLCRRLLDRVLEMKIKRTTTPTT